MLDSYREDPASILMVVLVARQVLWGVLLRNWDVVMQRSESKES